MEILQMLKSIRFPLLDQFMLAITNLGGEIAFLVVALILFWCIDKRKAYYILSIGFVGILFNQFLKLLFRVPRPWIHDPDIAIESAKADAGGYSFPSGHSQSSVGTFGAMAVIFKNKVFRVVCILICILVPVSRMYIGVHTLQDVLVGSAMAVALIFIMRPLIFSKDGKFIPFVLMGMTVLCIGYLLYVSLYPFPQVTDADIHSVESGTKQAYTLLGALSGFLVVYFVDEKWLRFDIKAVWWAQILKIVFGLILVLAIKEGLSAPLAGLLGAYPGRLVRYFLIVIFAGIVWPLTFKWFASLGKNNKKNRNIREEE